MDAIEFQQRLTKLQRQLVALETQSLYLKEPIAMISTFIDELQNFIDKLIVVTPPNLNHVMEETSHSILILDQQGNVVFSNSAGHRLFGDLQGQNLGIPLVLPEPQEINVMQNDAENVKVAEMTVRKISWQEMPSYLLILRDITANKQVEANLIKSRDFIEKVNQLLPDIIYVYDIAIKETVYVNDQLITFFGPLARQVQTPGKPIFTELLHPDDVALAEAHYTDLLNTENGEIIESQYRVKHPDTTWHWLRVRSLIFCRTDRGAPKQILGIAQDITQYKQTEVHLSEAKEMAEAANRAKSIFLANMSHELRTPLNAILGYTQILKRDGTLSAKQQEGIDIIHRSGEYLLTLISDILDISKIEANQFELHPIDFELSNFLRDIVSLFRIRAKQKDILLYYELLTTLPKTVYGDERRLRQVLINLLSNAIKFTDHGSISLKIDYNGGKICFQVEDTGIGITPDQLKIIFLPFQQVDQQSYRGEGTGLGLFITKRLVEMMAGTLRVESTFGQGSTFWVELNLPVVTGSQVQPPKHLTTITGYTGPRQKILIVDDKWENRAVLVNLLVPLGFEVAEACDGQEGIKKVLTFSPQLILMDLVMPNMDGFEATRRIRQHINFKNVIIIAVSASAFDFHRQESRAAGCDDFIPKPVYADVLLNGLQFHLQLNWVYEQKPAFFATPDNILPVQEIDYYLNYLTDNSLTLEQAETLFEQAKIGDIQGILDYSQKLTELKPNLGPFLDKIRELAEGLEDQRICEIIQRYLKKSP